MSFHADPSSITFLAGENGAGKTTLIKVALGLISPKAGNALFDGQSVGEIREKISCVFDEPSIGLDPPSWQLVQIALKQMTARGCAILITGQNYDAIENLADNIAILQSGKIIFSGPIVKLVQAFPVYVRIVTDDHREIAVQFPEAEPDSSGIYRIVCESGEQARAVIDQVRRSTLNFQELSTEKASMGKMVTDIYKDGFQSEKRGLTYESVQN
ncbi:ATP-binding cassette domain-containing protein [Bacillus licheniformis]|uniref:ATP-binding cassette domain-containing protein n=1 Tax=Bacillus licheniformis TaxID=1402 RepID=UPI000741493A|nr:ABC transporter [Bacillus licheniformis LMG 17339]